MDEDSTLLGDTADDSIIQRILNADPDLYRAVKQGAGKWGPAEWLILHPKAHRKWRKANGLPWPVPQRED